VQFLIIIVAGIVFLAPWPIYPSEDAMILFRYSENLIRYGIITYNPADHVPVEGATDFLWMVMLAALYGLHIPTYFASRLVSLLSLLGLGWIFSRLISKSEYRSTFYPAIVLFIMLQVPFWAAITGFSVYCFAFALFLSLWGFWENRYGIMILWGLISCLIRPDGCVFIAPLVAGYWLLNPATLSIRKNIVITITAVIAGLAYFLWRWHYFGLLLPLPFYVKSDCPRLLGVVCASSLEKHIATLTFYAPLLLYIVPGIRALEKPAQNKCYIIAIAFIAVPFLFYMTMHLTQNVAFRFYFPIMLTFPALATIVYRHASARRFWLLMALCTAIQLPVHINEGFDAVTPVGFLGIAKALGTLPYKGKIMASEAGVLAYYSGWETFDTVGLNTPKAALGRFQPEDIGLFNPDLIVLAVPTAHTDDRYSIMVQNVFSGVNGGNYEHYRLNGFYHLPPMAHMFNWLRGHKTLNSPLIGECWIRRDSPAYADLRRILEANGATP